MPEMWRFLEKVWNFWKVNLTGGSLIALLVIFQALKHSVAWWMYAGVASVTLLTSFFLAWREEYRACLSIEGRITAERCARTEVERQLEEAKQQLADERANKLSVDEIVLRESRNQFRNLTRAYNSAAAPRGFMNDKWVKYVAEKHGKTVAEIDAAIDRLDGKFHWQ